MERFEKLSNEMGAYRLSLPAAHGAGAFKDAARIIESMELQITSLERELEWTRREIARLHDLGMDRKAEAKEPYDKN